MGKRKREPERKPRWRVGDWVTAFRGLVQVIEYRGPLSHDGMPIYRLRQIDEYGTVTDFEQREDDLQPYDGPPPVVPPRPADQATFYPALSP